MTIMSLCGALLAGAKVFIPNENLVYCPERTLTQVIAHIHYFPVQWKGGAHSYKVMSELDLLFRYTAMYLLDELLSPIITPLILIFVLPHKSQDIVDFFRNFTVDVVGVGDVCSFAQMDVRRHGNPAWQVEKTVEKTVPRTNGYTQAEDGKTEMSLVHFTLTNPGWKPSGENEKYLAGLKTAAEKDVAVLSRMPEDEDNPMFSSLLGLQELGGSYREHALHVLNTVPSPPPEPGDHTLPPPHPTPPPPPVLRGALARCPGPLVISRSLLDQQPSVTNSSVKLTPSFTNANVEQHQADMAMSALYLHNINFRTRHARLAEVRRTRLRGNLSRSSFQASGYRFQREEDNVGGERDLLLPDISS